MQKKPYCHLKSGKGKKMTERSPSSIILLLLLLIAGNAYNWYPFNFLDFISESKWQFLYDYIQI